MQLFHFRTHIVNTSHGQVHNKNDLFTLCSCNQWVVQTSTALAQCRSCPRQALSQLLCWTAPKHHMPEVSIILQISSTKWTCCNRTLTDRLMRAVSYLKITAVTTSRQHQKYNINKSSTTFIPSRIKNPTFPISKETATILSRIYCRDHFLARVVTYPGNATSN
jgi:hypothetical protein